MLALGQHIFLVFIRSLGECTARRLAVLLTDYFVHACSLFIEILEQKKLCMYV